MTVSDLMAQAKGEFADLHAIHDGEFLHSERAQRVVARDRAVQYMGSGETLAVLDAPLIVAIFAALEPCEFLLTGSASLFEQLDGDEVDEEETPPISWAMIADHITCTECVQGAIKTLRTAWVNGEAEVAVILVCAQALRSQFNQTLTRRR